jgi:hypothetical protein
MAPAEFRSEFPDTLTPGVSIVHILDAAHSQPHVLNPNARVDAAGKLTYPAPRLAGDDV